MREGGLKILEEVRGQAVSPVLHSSQLVMWHFRGESGGRLYWRVWEARRPQTFPNSESKPWLPCQRSTGKA